jgi:DNA replication protein DnaC
LGLGCRRAHGNTRLSGPSKARHAGLRAGKSHLIQAIGRQACALDFRVRYWTSAGLLEELTASLADKSLPDRLRYYARFDLLIIDEFGFDKIERTECPEAASLLYKVIDSRTKKKSTALVTNVDFDNWKAYLPDAPLAMAFLDRLVDGALILKIPKAKSYRANRSKNIPATPAKESEKT